MGYRRQPLNEGEHVVVDVRPHWWYLAGAVVVTAIVIAGAVTAAVVSAPTWALWAALVALVLSLAWLVGRYARWTTTRLVVTTNRIIDRRGVVGRQGREIPLSALTDISYRQSVFERIIGAGDVVIESAGKEGQETFPDLPHPARIQNEIYRQMEQYRRPGPSPAGEASIPSQIEQLDQLRQRGIITDAEFEAKKAQLLDRL